MLFQFICEQNYWKKPCESNGLAPSKTLPASSRVKKYKVCDYINCQRAKYSRSVVVLNSQLLIYTRYVVCEQWMIKLWRVTGKSDESFLRETEKIRFESFSSLPTDPLFNLRYHHWALVVYPYYNYMVV